MTLLMFAKAVYCEKKSMIINDLRIHNEPFLSEEKIQSDFFLRLWNGYPQYRYRCFSIPNGSLREKKTAAKLKSSGVVAGVWDVQIIDNQGIAHFFEFKRSKKEKLTDGQKKFAAANSTCRYYIVDDSDVALAVAIDILNS